MGEGGAGIKSMLKIKNITKSFGGVQAIRGSNFVIKEKCVTALIGPNGAGKTTLFDIITGFLAPDSGQIIFNGTDITRLESFERVGLGMSRTWQQVRLFRHLTIADHLRMIEDGDDMRVWKNLFKEQGIPLRQGYEGRARNKEQYGERLKQFGIKKDVDTIVSELSYGQRKLLQICLAVSQPHTLLLLDEPVAGVNSVVQAQVEELLLDLKAQGDTMLLIDHDMGFVRKLADRVVVLDAGVVIAEGGPEVVLNDVRVLEAYLGA